MGNCLVTTLKASVNNGSLKKFNRLYVKFLAGTSMGEYLSVNHWVDKVSYPNDNKIIVESGSGYLLKNGVQMQEVTIENYGTNTSFGYVATSDMIVSIPNKNAINRLALAKVKSFVEADELKYLSWNEGNTLFEYLECSIEGSLDVTPIKTSYCGTGWGFELYGDFTNALKTYPYSRSYNDSLPVFYRNKAVADFSLLLGNLIISVENNGRVWPWKHTRTGYIMPFTDQTDPINFGSDLDAMLINQATLGADTTQADYSSYKIICVTGTKTSASDAAVATLKSKGFDVIINGVML